MCSIYESRPIGTHSVGTTSEVGESSGKTGARPSEPTPKASQLVGNTFGFLFKQLHAAVHYSPLAFAERRLEDAFQVELPERVRSTIITWLCLGYGLLIGIMHRMYRHLNAPLHSLPLQFWLPLVCAGFNTGVLFVALKKPAAYTKHWVLWSVLLRTAFTCTALLTWYLEAPMPLTGRITVLGAAFTLLVTIVTPVTFLGPCGAHLPLLVHAPVQLLVVVGMYRTEPLMCGWRLASPDMPAQLDTLSSIVKGLSPWVADLFDSHPELRCEFVLSYVHAIGTLAGTLINLSNEIAMRRAFLKHNAAAKALVGDFPAKMVATYPFGKAKGLLQSARVLTASILICLLSWEVFIVMKVQGGGAPGHST